MWHIVHTESTTHTMHIVLKGDVIYMQMSDEARAQKNAYQRDWRARNRDKDAKYHAEYWQRKAEKAKAAKRRVINGEKESKNTNLDE